MLDPHAYTHNSRIKTFLQSWNTTLSPLFLLLTIAQVRNFNYLSLGEAVRDYGKQEALCTQYTWPWISTLLTSHYLPSSRDLNVTRPRQPHLKTRFLQITELRRTQGEAPETAVSQTPLPQFASSKPSISSILTVPVLPHSSPTGFHLLLATF